MTTSNLRAVPSPQPRATPETQPAIAALARRNSEDARRRRARRGGIWFLRLTLLVGGLTIWQLLSSRQVIDPLFFSSPVAIYGFLVDFIGRGDVWSHTIVTIREMVLAFSIGSAAGIAIGLLLVSTPFLSDLFDPFLAALNALPRVALAPMFIIWFGIGEASKVALGVSLVFFIMLIATQTGGRSVDREYLTVIRALGANRFQLFKTVVLPGSVPAIFGGLRLAVVYALVGVMFGEMLAGREGLGQRLAFYASTFATHGVMGVLLILAVLALLINATVVAAERRLLIWNQE
jgi:NitT/TauT family transport system permease protein